MLQFHYKTSIFLDEMWCRNVALFLLCVAIKKYAKKMQHYNAVKSFYPYFIELATTAAQLQHIKLFNLFIASKHDFFAIRIQLHVFTLLMFQFDIHSHVLDFGSKYYLIKYIYRSAQGMQTKYVLEKANLSA